MYTKEGFFVTSILADPGFKHIVKYLNKTARHIGYVAPNIIPVDPAINVTGKTEYVLEGEKGLSKRDLNLWEQL